MGQDVRYAVRSMRRTPVFTAAVVVTIALGVGANTAAFSLMDAVLLRTLPVREPRQLVFLETAGAAGPAGAPTYPGFAHLREGTGAFAGMAAFAIDELRVEVDGVPEQVMGQVASGNFFALLGVEPAVGRLLSARDERLDAPVAVISHRYWQRRFGGDPAAVGKTLSFGGRTFTIAGVTPPEFWGLLPGRPVDVTIPITVAGEMLTNPVARWFSVVARLAPGVGASRGEAEASAVYRAFVASAPPPAGASRDGAERVELRAAAHGLDALRRRFSRPLYALAGVVVLVLLIAAANITNLLLARGTARRREYAVRLATGAGRARLLRQLLTETTLLYALGAVPAVFLAAWGVRAIAGAFAQGRRAITLDAGIDWRVLAFTTAVTLAAALLSGLVPAWRAFRTDPRQAVGEGAARTGESRRAGAMGRALVAVQVALSLVLLVGAAAFVRTLASLRDVDLGFRADHVLTMSVEPRERAADARASVAYWARVLDAVRAVPGVRAAALSNATPLSGRDPRARVRFPGHPAPGDAAVPVNDVSEGYFETLGIPLLRGRLPTDRDGADAPGVALVNEAAARAYFPRGDPVGQLVELDEGDVRQVVAVVGDSKHLSVREGAPPLVYVAARQARGAARRYTLSVASALPEGALLRSVRHAVAAADPGGGGRWSRR
jgi:predicted permease